MILITDLDNWQFSFLLLILGKHKFSTKLNDSMKECKMPTATVDETSCHFSDNSSVRKTQSKSSMLLRILGMRTATWLPRVAAHIFLHGRFFSKLYCSSTNCACYAPRWLHMMIATIIPKERKFPFDSCCFLCCTKHTYYTQFSELCWLWATATCSIYDKSRNVFKFYWSTTIARVSARWHRRQVEKFHIVLLLST